MSDDLAGQSLADRYDVLELLGTGGMGAVYRARDRELDELVALKVIRADLAALPEMVERFRHEVKLARRVTHTNVARTFELGNASGVVYCTMELVEGESLTARLAQRRRLPVGEAVAIASAVCDGLAAAHAAGVVHRDIKPDNVLVASDGRVVLADFGVAAVAVTSAGELSGTPAYMSPEQARGEPPTPAADVYAVGVLLFEMLAGRRAFSGDASAILQAKQDVPAVQAAPADMPPELAGVIATATARDVTARIASASALRRALDPWARPGRAPTQPAARIEAREVRTVVVHRPVPDPAVDGMYLANAVYDELIARIWRMPRVRVLQAADQPGDVSAHVRIGVDRDAFLVTIATSDEPHVTLRLPLDFDHLAPVIEAAAEALDAMLSVDQRFPRDERRSEAQDLVLRASYLIKTDLRRIPEAIAMLERARALVPDDARAAALLAFSHARVAFFMPNADPGAMRRAIELSQLAITAAPELADARIAAGHVALNTGDAIEAAIHFRAAIASAPHIPEAHEFLGRLLLEAGYLDAGFARIAEAERGSHGIVLARWDVARAYALEQRWDDHDRLVAELIAGGQDRHVSRVRFVFWRRDWATLAAMRPAFDAPGATQVLLPELLQALFAVCLDGAYAQHRAALLSTADRTSPNARRRSFTAQLIAEAAAFAGDIATCVDQIQFAYDSGLFDRHWMDLCPMLDNARGNPAFEALRVRVKARADAILDALYGDRDVGTSDTAIASSMTR